MTETPVSLFEATCDAVGECDQDGDLCHFHGSKRPLIPAPCAYFARIAEVIRLQRLLFAAIALEAAALEVDDPEAAETLARLADLWRPQITTPISASDVPPGDPS